MYEFVSKLKLEAHQRGLKMLADELDDALRSGSSALEILGAIRQTIINHRDDVESLLGADGKLQVEQIVAFVDKMYGR